MSPLLPEPRPAILTAPVSLPSRPIGYPRPHDRLAPRRHALPARHPRRDRPARARLRGCRPRPPRPGAGRDPPLDAVLAAARAAVPGDVVSVDLKHDEGHWLYKLRILGADGKRRTVKVDAGSLKILDEDDDD
ncbi:PepSY domain-containing protein [Methylobacterium oryzae CBMB20]